MKKELEQKIHTDFPKMFPKFGSPSPMIQRSFEVSDGWFAMIYKLCADIEAECVRLGIEDSEWPTVNQCKQKFGTLRFYVDHGKPSELKLGIADMPSNQLEFRPISNIENIYQLIDEAEVNSATICEECGIPGKLFRAGYWRTHCELCEARYQKEMRDR